MLSHGNPIIYMVNAFRYGFLGLTDVPMGLAFTVIIGFILVFYGVAHYLVTRGIGLRH
jgi:ABC-2 type transport system permease protein